jgi:hypothetical protein
MKKKIIATIAGLLTLFLVQSCYKATTVKIDNTPAVTKTISFSADITPIFNRSCALSGCHGSGGQKPDLSQAGAYSSLIAGNYLNKSSPSNSVVYLWLTGKEAVTMPIGGNNNPSNINALVLAWITQGAKNN